MADVTRWEDELVIADAASAVKCALLEAFTDIAEQIPEQHDDPETFALILCRVLAVALGSLIESYLCAALDEAVTIYVHRGP
jgi:hypothetical protein